MSLTERKEVKDTMGKQKDIGSVVRFCAKASPKVPMV
jgi:hypothetical protein